MRPLTNVSQMRGNTTSLCFAGLTHPAHRDWVTSGLSKKPAICAASWSMKLTSTGRASLYSGIGLLTAVLTNRLVLTPLDSLAQTQSRSDILGVIAGATLVLYGVGKAEIADTKKPVQLSGVDVRKGFEDMPDSNIGYEVEWAATALLSAIPNVKSCAFFVDGVGRFFLGRFRENEFAASVITDGVLELALRKGERVYLADMKTVLVKDVEFGYLPNNCQVGSVKLQLNESMWTMRACDKSTNFNIHCTCLF